MRIINASIDLTKVSKDQIVTTGKDGQPFKNGAKYLNITIFVNDEVNQFDQDTGIAMAQSKEQNEAGEKKVYIGNGKTVFNKVNDAPDYPKTPGTNYAKPTPLTTSMDDEYLPF